ncbi:hypothetical protein [Escherichia coli]|uniref:hypothetical protein n=1 Tax=Escherichia coli TaxID=562 RepID=UPI0018E578BD|nr:hypothetical protein [Escherichia coli]
MTKEQREVFFKIFDALDDIKDREIMNTSFYDGSVEGSLKAQGFYLALMTVQNLFIEMERESCSGSNTQTEQCYILREQDTK